LKTTKGEDYELYHSEWKEIEVGPLSNGTRRTIGPGLNSHLAMQLYLYVELTLISRLIILSPCTVNIIQSCMKSSIQLAKRLHVRELYIRNDNILLQL